MHWNSILHIFQGMGNMGDTVYIFMHVSMTHAWNTVCLLTNSVLHIFHTLENVWNTVHILMYVSICMNAQNTVYLLTYTLKQYFAYFPKYGKCVKLNIYKYTVILLMLLFTKYGFCMKHYFHIYKQCSTHFPRYGKCVEHCCNAYVSIYIPKLSHNILYAHTYVLFVVLHPPCHSMD